MENKKTCFKCKKEKSLNEFYIHKEMMDGHLNKCKDCTKKDVHLYRELNIEKIRKYDRERATVPHRKKTNKKYAQSQKGKKVHNKASKKWIISNSVKRATQIIFNNAIRSGYIKKETCEVCGKIVGVHGHHNDYAFPFIVRWLCPKHHSELHKKYKNEKEDICHF